MAPNIDTFIQKGLLLITNIQKTKEVDPYKIIDKIFEYDFWRLKISGYLRSKKQFVTEKIVRGLDTLAIDPVDWTFSFLDKKTKTSAIRLYIENVGKWIRVLEKLKPKMEEERIKIFISNTYGIYRLDENNQKIPCKIKKARLAMMLLILGGESSGPKLAKLYKQGESDVSKAIKAINKRLKRELGLLDDLIVSKETGGYRFNDEYIVTE